MICKPICGVRTNYLKKIACAQPPVSTISLELCILCSLLLCLGIKARRKTVISVSYRKPNQDQSKALVLNRWAMVHWWATARKSGMPQTFAYFINGCASQMRLSNSGVYEPPYGPAPMNWRRNDFIFVCKSTPIPTAD